jgi:hypothetical protein
MFKSWLAFVRTVQLYRHLSSFNQLLELYNPHRRKQLTPKSTQALSAHLLLAGDVNIRAGDVDMQLHLVI